MVNVSAHELDSFVNAASYIFETGAYHNLSEEQLKSSLEEQGMAALQVRGAATRSQAHVNSCMSLTSRYLRLGCWIRSCLGRA